MSVDIRMMDWQTQARVLDAAQSRASAYYMIGALTETGLREAMKAVGRLAYEMAVERHALVLRGYWDHRKLNDR